MRRLMIALSLLLFASTAEAKAVKIAFVDMLGEELAADHDGHAQGRGDDRGVVGSTTEVGCETDDLGFAERSSLHRRHLMGHDDDGLVDLGQTIL